MSARPAHSRPLRAAAPVTMLAGALSLSLAGAPASAGAHPLPPACTRGTEIVVSVGRAFARGELPIAVPAPLAGVRELDGRNARGQGLVAFTFDDGPAPSITDHVLDTLAAHGVHATFFVVGRHLLGTRAPGGFALLEREIAEGHWIGNHTLHHDRLAVASRATAWQTIIANENLITSAMGTRPTLFRPPYGKLSPSAEKLLFDLDYTVVRWSIDVKDFAVSSPTALRDVMLARILADDGGIVLLHDTHPFTAIALPGILAGIDRENCRRVARGRVPLVAVPLDLLPGAADPAAQAPRIAAARAAVVERCRKPPTPRTSKN